MYGPDFTFLGIPRCDLDKPETYKGADVIIVGAPIDSGTSYRSGAKMGPQAIRMGDYLPHDAERPHLSMRIDPLQKLKIYDAGDLLMPGGDLVASLEVLANATEQEPQGHDRKQHHGRHPPDGLRQNHQRHRAGQGL